MNRIVKSAALLAVVTCIVWVAVLWRWDTTRRDMTVADIALYLAALPLTVFGVLLGLRWAWRGAGPRRDARLAAIAATGAAPSAAVVASGEAPRQAPVHLLAAHVACHAGASPTDVLVASAEHEPRPELDAELRDADGMAVMCARIDNLQPDVVSEAFAPVLATLRLRRAEWAAESPRDHVLRALACLAEPLADALRSLSPWAVRLGAPERDAAAMPVARLPAAAAPTVRWLLGWPASWSEFERDAATEWACQQISTSTDIPLQRFVVTAQSNGSGEELWLRADQLLQTLAREERGDLLLVTACHSGLSEPAVAALEQAQRLFSALHQPKGLMPGEAAAALLLANVDWPADPDALAPPVVLHRAAVLRREQSIEAPGRVSSLCLQTCAERALATAALARDDVKSLVCDADQHTPRGAELFGTALAHTPHLDPTEDMRLIGVTTGHTGIVNTLLVVATAAERALADAAPCLALCLGDPSMRLALVARPATPPTVSPAGRVEPANDP